MEYQSTRNIVFKASSAAAIVDGLAPDGGLYVMPSFENNTPDYKCLIKMDTIELMSEVLCTLLPSFEKEEMREIVKNSYKGKFETEDLTPSVSVGEDTVLELFRGPTSAFKDVALSILPRLLTASKEKCGTHDDILVLTATSGDTGKAAMEGFRDVPGTKIIVFYPEAGVSPVQKAQMVTQEGKNVCVCAVRGNFDDAQRGVKEIFSEVNRKGLLCGKGVRLSSANSINIGRLAPQVAYYFRAYGDLVNKGVISCGDKVDFCVPTGNFGNILAGFTARSMGLPVGKLVCASNANNVLTEFLTTGYYDRNRPFYKTVSPSMDILVSSNLERLLYMMKPDPQLIEKLMRELRENGKYKAPDDIMQSIHDVFWQGFCDDENTKKAIGKAYDEYGYLCDTHTAVAWDVAQQYKLANPDHNHVVILSTASPYKFPAAVLEGIGERAYADEFALMDRINEKTHVPVPKNLLGLQTKEVRHKDVIDKDEMMGYVLKKAAEKEWF